MVLSALYATSFIFTIDMIVILIVQLKRVRHREIK